MLQLAAPPEQAQAVAGSAEGESWPSADLPRRPSPLHQTQQFERLEACMLRQRYGNGQTLAFVVLYYAGLQATGRHLNEGGPHLARSEVAFCRDASA